jgi:hypothetical protein
MEPVVAFLELQGLSTKQISLVVTEHPPVLSYSIDDRLRPLLEYLNTVGVPDVPGVRYVPFGPDFMPVWNCPARLMFPCGCLLFELQMFHCCSAFNACGMQVVASRPSILGLEAENIRLIVDYLQANDYKPEQISEYLKTTI